MRPALVAALKLQAMPKRKADMSAVMDGEGWERNLDRWCLWNMRDRQFAARKRIVGFSAALDEYQRWPTDDVFGIRRAPNHQPSIADANPMAGG